MSVALEDSLVPEGHVFVRPIFKDGAKGDPYVIFANPDFARSVIPLTSHGLDLSHNMVVNQGRQAIANLLGGKDSGTSNWRVTSVSWGTFDEAPRFSDATLSPQKSSDFAGGENEITYDGTNRKKPLLSTDFPAPFLTRFEAFLAEDEGNGYTLREMGLWTGNGTLFARKTMVPVLKSADFALSFIWVIRF